MPLSVTLCLKLIISPNLEAFRGSTSVPRMSIIPSSWSCRPQQRICTGRWKLFSNSLICTYTYRFLSTRTVHSNYTERRTEQQNAEHRTGVLSILSVYWESIFSSKTMNYSKQSSERPDFKVSQQTDRLTKSDCFNRADVLLLAIFLCHLVKQSINCIGRPTRCRGKRCYFKTHNASQILRGRYWGQQVQNMFPDVIQQQMKT